MSAPLRRVRLPLALALVSAVVWTVSVPAAGAGQSGADLEDREQARLLQEASLLENRGEHDEAERRFRALLERSPGVAAAVFGLERMLRRRARLSELLPFVDRYQEARPDGKAIRHLELRVLAELDSLDALETAAREWIERDGVSLETYAEIAAVFEGALGPDRALDVVGEARKATGRPGALALEAGTILARSGRPGAAGREWSRAIEDDGRNLSLVLREIDALPGDTREVVGTLLANLELDADSAGGLRGAARLALAAGLTERAVELATDVLETSEGRSRKGFLVRFAQRAEERGADAVALWAYRRLRESPETEDEGRALDGRIAELALSTGDTALALEARDRIASSHPTGSIQRRRALAAQLELEAGRAHPEAAARRLVAFRSEYPDAPELDALAADVARRLVAGGAAEDAARVLAEVEGPRSALERAYLDLGAGEVESGAAELEASITGLSPVRATSVIELLAVLESAGPRGGELAGRVAALAHRGRGAEALELLRSGLDGVALDDRPGLLALGARIAEAAGYAEDAGAFRARLVRDYPDAAEAPEAAIRLARYRAGDPEGDREAARILEELILSRPDAAVVPEARRELEKLKARITGSGR